MELVLPRPRAEEGIRWRWPDSGIIRDLFQRISPRERITDPRVAAQHHYLEQLGQQDRARSASWTKTLYRLTGGRTGYLQELNRFNRSLPSMHKDCKMSVVIAAANEEQNITRTLEGWTTRQHRVNPNDYEIVVLVNKPNAAAKWDKTADRVREFQRKNPRYRIRLVQKEFNFPEQDIGLNGQRITKGVHMGLIFKFASDLSLLRNLNRKSTQKANHMIITSGGDVVARHPKFVRWLLAQGQKEPGADFLKIGYGLAPSVARRVPLYWAFHNYRNAFSDVYNGTRPRRHGAFRAAAYAGVGGFNPDRNVAEEIEFGKRLTDAGAVISEPEFIGVLDNPRRSLHTLLANRPMVGEYRNFDADEALKDMGEGHLRQIPPWALLNAQNLSREVSSHFNAYMQRMRQMRTPGWFTKTQRMLAAGMEQIGLTPADYRVQVQQTPTGRITGARVQILNVEKVWQAHRQSLQSQTHSWVRQAPMF